MEASKCTSTPRWPASARRLPLSAFFDLNKIRWSVIDRLWDVAKNRSDVNARHAGEASRPPWRMPPADRVSTYDKPAAGQYHFSSPPTTGSHRTTWSLYNDKHNEANGENKSIVELWWCQLPPAGQMRNTGAAMVGQGIADGSRRLR